MATPEMQRSLGQVDNLLSPTVRIVSEPGQVHSLADAWGNLAARGGYPTQQYEWASASAASFARPGDVRVVVIGEPNPVAILGLTRRPGVAGRLEMLGGRELYEPTDALCTGPAAVRSLANTLARLNLPLFLNRIPADSPLVRAMQDACRRRGLLVLHFGKGCPWISLDETWKQPEQHFNAGRRSDFRRARRAAEQLGPVCFEILAPSPDEAEPLFNEALQVEAAGWKGRKGSALLDDPSRCNFFRKYVAAMSARGSLRLCFFRIAGQVAAMQVAVENERGFWLLKIGYRAEFERCSPGNLLMLETVRYAAMRGLPSYEFLGKVEPWTQMWTQTVRPCVSLLFYPATLRGGLALAADAVDIFHRRIKSYVGGHK